MRLISRGTQTCILFCLLAILSLCPAAFGYPHQGERFSLRQPDGSRVEVRVWGDEFYQDVESPDGYTLIRDPHSGWICYATLAADGQSYLSTGRVYPGRTSRGLAKAGAPAGLSRHLRIAAEAIARARLQRREILWPHDRPGLSKSTAPLSTKRAAAVDTVYGLTLLIDFPDLKSGISQSEIDNYCNQIGYSDFENAGSVRDYFHDISNGKLLYINLVTPFITMSRDKSYYDVANGYGPVAEMLDEALTKAKNQGFDFSRLSRRNGRIVAFNVFYAGSPDNGWANGLWPHASNFEGSFTVNGVGFGKYQITNLGEELSLGTFCHENGHMLLGWPDLYAYDGHSKGVDKWCLMSLQDFKNPQQPNPYFRFLEGWLDVSDISSAPRGMVYSHEANSATVFRYAGATHGSSREYFFIEARRKEGRSQKLPGEGLLIWHVDENGRNTDAAYKDLCVPEQADGEFDLENNRAGDGADPFRFGHNDRFNDNTAPNARWHNGASSGIDIANISAVGECMTFSIGPDISPWILVSAPQQGAVWKKGSPMKIKWLENLSRRAEPRLTIVSAAASSAQQAAGLAIDGNGSTRWESAVGIDPSWIMVDLGHSQEIGRVRIDWEAANARDYRLEGSNDASSWTTLASRVGMANQARSDELTGLAGSYRYLRVYGTSRNLTYGYSIWELAVYGRVSNSDEVTIELQRFGTTIARLAPAASNSGLFEWIIPDSMPVGDNYQIRITSLQDGSISGRSGFFAVIAYIPTLTVIGGEGSGNYQPGTIVTLKAEPPTEGKMFERWEGELSLLDDACAPTTRLTMPDSDLTCRALYKDEPVEGILMPPGKGNVVTVSDTFFFDDGGKYDQYHNFFTGEITFVPRQRGQVVQLEFLAFGIEDTSDGRVWDTLKVFDGSSISSPLIGAYWGTQNPGTIVSSAADGSLTVRFCADEWTVGGGWRARVTCMARTRTQSLAAALPDRFDLRAAGDAVYYQLPAQASGPVAVSIVLYDLRGARVCELVKATLPAGYHAVKLGAGRGRHLARGSYICRMQCAGFAKALRLNLVR